MEADGVHDQMCTSRLPAIDTVRPDRADAKRSIGPFRAFQSVNASVRTIAAMSTPSTLPVQASALRARGEGVIQDVRLLCSWVALT